MHTHTHIYTHQDGATAEEALKKLQARTSTFALLNEMDARVHVTAATGMCMRMCMRMYVYVNVYLWARVRV
jgi:hypothetical protein